MKYHLGGSRTVKLSLPAAAIILLLASTCPLMAQRERNAQRAARNRGNQTALNEWSRTHMKEVAAKQFEKRLVSLLPQIKEDFTRIQVVNNAMMRRVFDEGALDFRVISESIMEIRKRANRLKLNLMLPEPEVLDKSQRVAVSAPADGRVKDSLLTLDTMIMGFVKNPLFQKPGVIDAKLSTQAGRDLKTIIEFSGDIRKEIERLSKQQTRP
jgi:hypothetical protein